MLLWLTSLVVSAASRQPWFLMPLVGFCPVSLDSRYIGDIRVAGSDFNDNIGYTTAGIMMFVYLWLGIKAWTTRSAPYAIGLCAIAAISSVVFLLRLIEGIM
jgi:hypothetical protein